ncbi:MAG: hypothetical protein LH650_03870 [Chloroflexi bacterium]|nr:hypothetical protein [Chloroflexota bacterium]
MSAPKTLSTLLEKWRAAERAWGQAGVGSPAFSNAVIRAWLDYQEGANAKMAVEELILVRDTTGRMVAAGGPCHAFLGLHPADLVGLGSVDITAPDLVENTPGQWQRFLEDGQMSGAYILRRSDGGLVPTHFTARAHEPLPGFHAARHRLALRIGLSL